MNAGAYGGEVSHILVSAQILTPAGYVETLDNRELRFGYRSSILQENGAIVLSAKLPSSQEIIRLFNKKWLV